MKRYLPINSKYPHFLHGGDYNPDQWIRTPEIWDEDIRLMKLANCNTMSIGIFSWTSLEQEEGKFQFGWLDSIMDKLTANGAYAVLATPSGSKPAWMSEKYPQVRRTKADGIREVEIELEKSKGVLSTITTYFANKTAKEYLNCYVGNFLYQQEGGKTKLICGPTKIKTVRYSLARIIGIYLREPLEWKILTETEILKPKYAFILTDITADLAPPKMLFIEE